MTIFMETTRISAEQTARSIQDVLAKYGAQAILIEYENKQLHAVSFRFEIEGQAIPFKLPCRWELMVQVLKKRGKFPSRGDTWEIWARRIAWRQILRWVEAQMALVETSMVKVTEIFFPYIETPSGQTLYQLHESKLLLLGSGLNSEEHSKQ